MLAQQRKTRELGPLLRVDRRRKSTAGKPHDVSLTVVLEVAAFFEELDRRRLVGRARHNAAPFYLRAARRFSLRPSDVLELLHSGRFFVLRHAPLTAADR